MLNRRGFLKATAGLSAIARLVAPVVPVLGRLALVVPAGAVLVRPGLVRGASYWGIQVTLTTSRQQLLTLLQAVDPTVPQKPSRTDLQFDVSQFDPMNPYSQVICIGDFSLTTSRKAYELLPGGTASYTSPTSLVPINALGNVSGLLLNVQVIA